MADKQKHGQPLPEDASERQVPLEDQTVDRRGFLRFARNLGAAGLVGKLLSGGEAKAQDHQSPEFKAAEERRKKLEERLKAEDDARKKRKQDVLDEAAKEEQGLPTPKERDPHEHQSKEFQAHDKKRKEVEAESSPKDFWQQAYEFARREGSQNALASSPNIIARFRVPRMAEARANALRQRFENQAHHPEGLPAELPTPEKIEKEVAKLEKDIQDASLSARQRAELQTRYFRIADIIEYGVRRADDHVFGGQWLQLAGRVALFAWEFGVGPFKDHHGHDPLKHHAEHDAHHAVHLVHHSQEHLVEAVEAEKVRRGEDKAARERASTEAATTAAVEAARLKAEADERNAQRNRDHAEQLAVRAAEVARENAAAQGESERLKAEAQRNHEREEAQRNRDHELALERERGRQAQIAAERATQQAQEDTAFVELHDQMARVVNGRNPKDPANYASLNLAPERLQELLRKYKDRGPTA